jgi:hypothetical protein
LRVFGTAIRRRADSFYLLADHISSWCFRFHFC